MISEMCLAVVHGQVQHPCSRLLLEASVAWLACVRGLAFLMCVCPFGGFLL